jgi:hypothetical protein
MKIDWIDRWKRNWSNYVIMMIKDEIIIWLDETRIIWKSKLYRRIKAMIAKIIDQSADLYVYICTHIVIVLRTSTFDDDWSIVENEESISHEINSAHKMLVDDVQTTFVKFVDDQSTRKSMKSVSIMIVQKIIVMSNTKHFNKILLKENAKINVMNYHYAIAHDMTSIDNDFSISSHVKKKSMHCYDVYNVRIRFVDN